MFESIPNAMPACFEKWCQLFDDVFSRQSQQAYFRTYLAGLLSETKRKNISAIASNTVGVGYFNLHHFLHDAPWDLEAFNNRRIDVIYQNRQARPSVGFRIILDDSGHRKSGESTDGVARQYLGQIGKVDNGMVHVTTHLFDGKRAYPLDLAMYKPAGTLENGKEDEQFKKKPELALQLIDKSIARGLVPGLTLFDSGYGNNGPFLQAIEQRNLKYVAALVSSRKISIQMEGQPKRTSHRLDEVVKTIKPEQFKKVTLQLDKPRDVWVAALHVFFPKLGDRTIAFQMNAPTLEEASEVCYFLTNVEPEKATAEWIAQSYSERNWIEVFYREVKGWLGMTHYQVRDQRSIERHWYIAFNAFTFLTFQRLTGGLRRQYSTKPIETFGDSYRVFCHAVENMLLKWLPENLDALVAHRASRGLIFA